MPISLKIQDVQEWGVLHTRSRFEKSIESKLQSKDIPVFLPTLTNRRVYGNRIRESALPLFPGYLFYDAERASRIDILQTDGVVQMIRSKSPRRLRAEVLNLYQALQRDPVSWREINFKVVGAPVEVIGGPLKGIDGEFIRLASRDHLIIRISILGRSVETLIDQAHVRPLS